MDKIDKILIDFSRSQILNKTIYQHNIKRHALSDWFSNTRPIRNLRKSLGFFKFCHTNFHRAAIDNIRR